MYFSNATATRFSAAAPGAASTGAALHAPRTVGTGDSVSRRSGALDVHGFAELRRRAIAAINARIADGYFTERGLARVARVSQPHTPHILNGQRIGNLDILDKLCHAAGVSPFALASEMASTEEAWWKMEAA